MTLYSHITDEIFTFFNKLNPLSSFRWYAAIRKYRSSVSCGSGGDCDVVKILQIWMTGIENWIFEADEYQLSAKFRISLSD